MPSNPFQAELERRTKPTVEVGTPRVVGQDAPQNPFSQELERRQQGDGGALETAEGLGASFTGGALDVIGMPADLINIPLEAAGLPRIPSGGRDLRALASQAGMTFEPGKEPQGLAHRAARIAGSSAIPTAGIMARGGQVARQGARALGGFDQAARAAATQPGTTLGFEGASVGTAALGGETAKQVFPDNPVAEAIGELAGGFTPAAAVSGPVAKLASRGADLTKRGAFPFTQAGGKLRAARRLQSASADPDQAAARVSGEDTLPKAELTPARRTGDRRLLSIERAVANEDPAFDAELTERLSGATRTAREAADLGGEPSRVRDLLENRREYLLDLVDRRATQAANKAQEAIEGLDPNATPRQTSRAAREKIEAALQDAQSTESRLWGSLDKKASASLENSRAALQTELAGRSKFEDPADIPPWLKKPLTGRKAPKVKFGDVHALRKRVGSEIGKERAQAAPNRNKIRILSNVYDSLLEDMATAEGQGEALGTALAYSRKLNEKFRQGAVGRLLGHERRGGLSVTPEDTLRRVLSGEASGTQVRQLLEAAPESAGEVKNYLRSSFLVQTMEDGKFNPRASRTFLKKHDEVLEKFPDLRSELTNTREMNRLADRLGRRQKAVERLAYNTKKSRAALYLDGPIDEEWGRVLRADKPAAVARALRRKVGSDPKAVQGLKSSFVEELIKRSETRQFDEAGQPFVSGNRLKKMLDDYDDVASAIGLSDGEKSRLQRVANTFSRIEQTPAGREAVMEDRPAAILDLIARWMGAQSGQRIASGGTGSSLVMAQAFSQRMRGMLQRFTRDKATELISAAVRDPNLFRELMVGPTASEKAQRQAIQRINTWLAAPAAEQSQEKPQ